MAGQSTLDFIAHRNLTGRYAKGAPLSHKTYNFIDDIDAQVTGKFDEQKEEVTRENNRWHASVAQHRSDAAEYLAAMKREQRQAPAAEKTAVKETLQDSLVANAEKAKLPSFTKVRAALKVKAVAANTDGSNDVAATFAAAAKRAAESVRVQGNWTAATTPRQKIAKKTVTKSVRGAKADKLTIAALAAHQTGGATDLPDGSAKEPLARRRRLEPVIEMPSWQFGESSAASRQSIEMQSRERGISEDEGTTNLHGKRERRESIDSAEGKHRRQARYDTDDYMDGTNRDSRQDSYASGYGRERSDSREPQRSNREYEWDDSARPDNGRAYHDRGRDDEPRGHSRNEPEAHLNWNKIAETVRSQQDDKTNGMFGKKLKMSKIKGKKKAGAKGNAAGKKKKTEKEKSSSSSSSSSDSSSSESESSADKKQKKEKKEKKEKKAKESQVNRVFSEVVIDQDSDLEVVSGSDLEIVSCATIAQPLGKKNKKDKKDKKDKKEKKDKKDKKEKKDKKTTLCKPVETKVAPIASQPPPKRVVPKAPPQPAFKPLEERPEI